jgi:ubiquinone/menaquinone biosynthesis C-methylase UbiE
MIESRRLKRVVYTSDRLKRIPGLGGILWRMDRTARNRFPESAWFWDHYETASRQIVGFCEPHGVQLGGIEVADVGCGDGIMALGLAHRARPRAVVGFDVVPTNVDALAERARRERVAEPLPSALEFRQSTQTELPAADGSFDFVYSWSAFEHIAEPVRMLQEIRRIVRPTGRFFLQLWPFYLSPGGSHLEDWFGDDFHHLRQPQAVITQRARASGRHSTEWTEMMIREFEHLNRLTLADLQSAVIEAGFEPAFLQLLPAAARLAPELREYSWADIGIGGIKLLAMPRADL